MRSAVEAGPVGGALEAFENGVGDEGVARVERAPGPDLLPVGLGVGQEDQLRGGEAEEPERAGDEDGGEEEQHLPVEEQAEAREEAGGQRLAAPGGEDGGGLDGDQHQVRADDHDGGGDAEGEEERRQRRGEALLLFAPEMPGEPAERPRRERDEQRAGDAQRQARRGAEQQVEAGEQRRLVEPDIGIETVAAQHLRGRRQRVALLHPEDVQMRQPEGESEREQQGVEGGGRHGDYCFSSSSSLRRSPGP